MVVKWRSNIPLKPKGIDVKFCNMLYKYFIFVVPHPHSPCSSDWLLIVLHICPKILSSEWSIGSLPTLYKHIQWVGRYLLAGLKQPVHWYLWGRGVVIQQVTIVVHGLVCPPHTIWNLNFCKMLHSSKICSRTKAAEVTVPNQRLNYEHVILEYIMDFSSRQFCSPNIHRIILNILCIRTNFPKKSKAVIKE